MKARRLTFVILGGAALAASASAQVPDLLNAFDAGGRAMGTAGALYATSADTLSTYYNPAGLGYLQDMNLGLVYRNLPKSDTVASDEFDDLDYDTDGERGGNAITHIGLTFPLQQGRGGTIGVSFTTGGYINDTRTNGGVLVGGQPVNFYREDLEAKTDFFTIAWGRTNSAQNLSFGAGLVFAQQKLDYSLDLVDGNGITLSDTDVSDTGTGVGVILGVQYIPRNNPNLSLGASYRSEINLGNNDDTEGLYDRIPARLILGAALRQDGLRGGRDFIVYGAQVQHFFSAGDSSVFEREAQTVLGLGLEYNYTTDSFRIPVRFGYNLVPGAGEGYGSRNGFAFGIGYRPNNSDYALDLNFMYPERGGYDFSIGLNYRFGNR